MHLPRRYLVAFCRIWNRKRSKTHRTVVSATANSNTMAAQCAHWGYAGDRTTGCLCETFGLAVSTRGVKVLARRRRFVSADFGVAAFES